MFWIAYADKQLVEVGLGGQWALYDETKRAVMTSDDRSLDQFIEVCEEICSAEGHSIMMISNQAAVAYIMESNISEIKTTLSAWYDDAINKGIDLEYPVRSIEEFSDSDFIF